MVGLQLVDYARHVVKGINRGDYYRPYVFFVSILARSVTYMLVVCLEVLYLSLVFLRLHRLTDKVHVDASVRNS